MERLLISACLIGSECKYSGGSNALGANELNALRGRYLLVPVCPETAGGLGVPREPSERLGGRVVARSGRDVTEQFSRGAEVAEKLCRRFGCAAALLKERSPSCGKDGIYDGSFTGTLVPGAGLCAERLAAMGVELFGESELDRLMDSAE